MHFIINISLLSELHFSSARQWCSCFSKHSTNPHAPSEISHTHTKTNVWTCLHNTAQIHAKSLARIQKKRVCCVDALACFVCMPTSLSGGTPLEYSDLYQNTPSYGAIADMSTVQRMTVTFVYSSISCSICVVIDQLSGRASNILWKCYTRKAKQNCVDSQGYFTHPVYVKNAMSVKQARYTS